MCQEPFHSVCFSSHSCKDASDTEDKYGTRLGAPKMDEGFRRSPMRHPFPKRRLRKKESVPPSTALARAADFPLEPRVKPFSSAWKIGVQLCLVAKRCCLGCISIVLTLEFFHFFAEFEDDLEVARPPAETRSTQYPLPLNPPLSASKKPYCSRRLSISLAHCLLLAQEGRGCC